MFSLLYLQIIYTYYSISLTSHFVSIDFILTTKVWLTFNCWYYGTLQNWYFGETRFALFNYESPRNRNIIKVIWRGIRFWSAPSREDSLFTRSFYRNIFENLATARTSLVNGIWDFTRKNTRLCIEDSIRTLAFGAVIMITLIIVPWKV